MSQFETITSGPSNATGQNPQATPNGLAFDKQNNLLASVGTSGVEQLLNSIIATFQNQTALTTITTAQNLISQALNSWFLNRANRNLKIRGRGIYTTAGTTTPTLTFAVTLGGTSLVSVTTAATSATASTNLPFEFEIDLSVAATGASAAEIEAHMTLRCNITANTPAAAVATYLDTNNSGPIGSLNLEEALTLDVTIAASATVTSAQLLWATIEANGN